VSQIAAPLSRVLLRYIVGALIVKGYSIDPATAENADVQAIAYYLIGGGLALLSEGWWYLARKYGWSQ